MVFKKHKLFRQYAFAKRELAWRHSSNERTLLSLDVCGVRFKYWVTFVSFFVQRWLALLLLNYGRSLLRNKLFKVQRVFDASFLFFLAMLKISPVLILKPMHFGSVVYEMPFPLSY